MKILKNTALFLIGGGSYVALELLYRRKSHISMFAAGGTCFLLLGKLRKTPLPCWSKPLLGAGIITSVELLFGLIFNRRHTVWDYRSLPANFRGQICMPFSVLWMPLSLLAMALHARLEAWLDRNGT